MNVVKFTIDAEFIDTPTVSRLLSFAIVDEQDRYCYFEFPYSDEHLTPWLREHVAPNLNFLPADWYTFPQAREEMLRFVGERRPEFWCHYGAYDWYWLCRIFGGMTNLPRGWPWLYYEYAWVKPEGVPNFYGPEHNALNDARSLMADLRTRRGVQGYGRS